jgi:hypothetical protein
MQRLRLIALAALTSALPVLAVRAQAPAADSTGFRAGQWGTEFTLGSNLGNPTGVGALRFHNARRALLLDVLGRVSRQAGDAPWTESQTFGRLRLGTRWYRPVTRQVLQSFTLGALMSRDRLTQQQRFAGIGDSAQTRYSSTGGGLFAELGANWMVTTHLSLGAAWTGDVLYSRIIRRSEGGEGTLFPPNASTRQWTASLGQLSLRAGVYF